MVTRGRVGLVVPSTNTTNEREFGEYVPDGVTVHAGRVTGGECTVETLERMADDIERAVSLLADARVDVVAFGCTTGSLVGGVGYADEIRSHIRETSGVPAVVTAGAVVEALSTLGASTLAVSTPYPAGINALVREYLEAHGFDVVAVRGLGLSSPAEVASVSRETVYDEAVAAAGEDADCLFVSCTDYPTFDVLAELEGELGRPVVTSNQATLWRALRVAGVEYDDVPLGRLFER